MPSFGPHGGGGYGPIPSGSHLDPLVGAWPSVVVLLLVLVLAMLATVGRGLAHFAEHRRRDRLQLYRLRKADQARVEQATRLQGEQVRQVLAEHDAVDRRWFGYEIDLGTVIDFPMMTDLREPLTFAFHRARLAAEELQPMNRERPAELAEPARLRAYRRAVRSYHLAFAAAENEARRRRHAGFGPRDKVALDRASKLVAVALDESATMPERQAAFRQAQHELDGVIAVPDAAADHLRLRIAGALPAAG